MERPSSEKDRYFMKNALNISLRGIGNTYPNPSVGAIVVKNNKIVSRGWTQPGGIPHAEVIALKNKNFSGATLYTTLEPCCHYGKAPPCIKQIINSRIKRVVIGIKDPNPKVNGKSITELKKNKINVTLGILKNEIKKIHLGFIYNVKRKKPFVSSKIALSKNGKMINLHGQWVTSKSSRNYGNFIRSKYDAILTGINTVLKDNPLLNCRQNGMESFSPVRFILDSKLRIRTNLKIVKSSKQIKTFIFTNMNNKKKILKLKKFQIKVIILNENSKRINLEDALFEIGKLGFNNVLLESGPNLNYAFFKKKLINKIFYFQSQKNINSNLISAEKKMNIKYIDKLKFKKISNNFIDNDILKIYEK